MTARPPCASHAWSPVSLRGKRPLLSRGTGVSGTRLCRGRGREREKGDVVGAPFLFRSGVFEMLRVCSDGGWMDGGWWVVDGRMVDSGWMVGGWGQRRLVRGPACPVTGPPHPSPPSRTHPPPPALTLLPRLLFQGSVGFPGFPGANGEKGGRVRTTRPRWRHALLPCESAGAPPGLGVSPVGCRHCPLRSSAPSPVVAGTPSGMTPPAWARAAGEGECARAPSYTRSGSAAPPAGQPGCCFLRGDFSSGLNFKRKEKGVLFPWLCSPPAPPFRL